MTFTSGEVCFFNRRGAECAAFIAFRQCFLSTDPPIVGHVSQIHTDFLSVMVCCYVVAGCSVVRGCFVASWGRFFFETGCKVVRGCFVASWGRLLAMTGALNVGGWGLAARPPNPTPFLTNASRHCERSEAICS